MSRAKCDQTREPHNIWRSLENSPSGTRPHPGLRIFSIHAYKIVGTKCSLNTSPHSDPLRQLLWLTLNFKICPLKFLGTLWYFCAKKQTAMPFGVLMRLWWRSNTAFGDCRVGLIRFCKRRGSHNSLLALSSFQQIWMYRQTPIWVRSPYDFKTMSLEFKKICICQKSKYFPYTKLCHHRRAVGSFVKVHLSRVDYKWRKCHLMWSVIFERTVI